MNSSPKNSDDKPTPPDSRAVILLLGSVADTTWRMFVPSIGFTLLGVWLDKQFGLTPWLMFGGIVLGFISAFLLVKQQIDKLKGQKERN